MRDSFDIFQLDLAGVRWPEAADSLDYAKTRVHELAVDTRGEYLLMNQKTGTKIVIKPERVDAV